MDSYTSSLRTHTLCSESLFISRNLTEIQRDVITLHQRLSREPFLKILRKRQNLSKKLEKNTKSRLYLEVSQFPVQPSVWETWRSPSLVFSLSKGEQRQTRGQRLVGNIYCQFQTFSTYRLRMHHQEQSWPLLPPLFSGFYRFRVSVDDGGDGGPSHDWGRSDVGASGNREVVCTWK